MANLSVIIVSFNTQGLLQDCLNSVFKAQAPAKGLEVIVVDNHSTDGTVEMVKKEFSQVKLIVNKANQGFAAANNQAAQIASGKYLLYLNPDTKLSRYALTKPLKYLKNHDRVGAVCVKLVLPDGRLDPDNHRGFPTPWTAITHFSGLDRLFPKSRIFNNYYQSYKNFNRIHSIDVGSGAYLLISAKLFQKIGGWDESYFFYGEDIDLSMSIHRAGKDIVYYPKVEVVHYKGATSGLRKESAHLARPDRQTRLKVARASTQAMEIFYRKYYLKKYPPILTAPVLLAIKTLGLIRLLKHHLK